MSRRTVPLRTMWWPRWGAALDRACYKRVLEPKVSGSFRATAASAARETSGPFDAIHRVVIRLLAFARRAGNVRVGRRETG